MTTTMARLIAQKQGLLRRLDDDDLSPNEREEIEATLKKIFTALDLLNGSGPGD